MAFLTKLCAYPRITFRVPMGRSTGESGRLGDGAEAQGKKGTERGSVVRLRAVLREVRKDFVVFVFCCGGASTLLAASASPAVAVEGARLSLGDFGPCGRVGCFFNTEPGVPNQLAFDVQSRKLLVLDESHDQILQLRMHAGLPGLPMPGATIAAAGVGNGGDVDVDNSGGPFTGRIYVLSNQENAVRAFDSSGSEISAGYPLKVGASKIRGVAVDASGHLWIGDKTAEVIREFTPAGVPTGVVADISPEPGSEPIEPIDFAFDSSDNLYVAVPSSFEEARIWRYWAKDGYAIGTREEIGPTQTARPTAIALDRGTGHLLVARRSLSAKQVDEYDVGSPGAPEVSSSPFVASKGVLEPSYKGLAVDPIGGFIYLSDTNNNYISIASRFGVHADVTTGAVTSVTNASAILQGSANPNGVPSTCEFEYGQDENYGQEAPCTVDPGAGENAVAVEANLTGLSPSTTYHYRLDVTGEGVGTITGKDKTFSTSGIASINGTSFVSSTAKEATVEAQIGTGNQDTNYWVEYGASSEYGQSTPSFQLNGGKSSEIAMVTVGGLQPDTSYHFRFVAENQANKEAGEASLGPDAELRTYPPASASTTATCSNAALRMGFSSSLPDCRAFELVSPEQTHGAPLSPAIIGAETAPIPTDLVSATGSSVLLANRLGYGPLPGMPGNGWSNVYEAKREAAGWISTSISPTGAESPGPRAGGVSADHGYGFWLVEAAGTLAPGTYLRHPDGTFSLIGEGEIADDLNARGLQISVNGSHVFFSSKVQLLADAPQSGTTAIYDRGPSGLTLASLLPEGVIPQPGENAIYLGSSSDGSAVVFSIGSAIYLRQNNATTLIANGNPTYSGMSTDGSRVFYLKNGNPFRYESLGTVQIASGGGVQPVNVSADGSHFYFVSEKKLTGDAKAGDINLYDWSGEGGTSFIGALDTADVSGSGFKEISPERKFSLTSWLSNLNPGPTVGPANDPSRSTPDGSALTFESHAKLTKYQNRNPLDPGEPLVEIYRYDSQDKTLICVSCSPVGAAPTSNARLQTSTQNAPLKALQMARNMSDDGSRIFFETGDALTPADTDEGVYDVYEWEAFGKGSCTQLPGCIYLITSGHSAPSIEGTRTNYFYGASPDGSDAFVLANDQLAPEAAGNGEIALFDARVEGGFPSSERASCEGEDCQGEPSRAPDIRNPATLRGGSAKSGTKKKKSRCAGKRHGSHLRKHCKRRSNQHRGHRR